MVHLIEFASTEPYIAIYTKYIVRARQTSHSIVARAKLRAFQGPPRSSSPNETTIFRTPRKTKA
jgi:hypothetical protein